MAFDGLPTNGVRQSGAVPRLLNQHGQPMRPSARFGGWRFGRGGYDGARSDSQQTANWSTQPLPASREVLDREQLAARARDLIRNSGIASAGLTQALSRTIGAGLRFRCTPDAEALGVDPQEALSWGRTVERELRDWGSSPSRQCDLACESTWGELQGIMYADRWAVEENLSALRWRPDRGTRYATCVQIIDPDRLQNEMGKMMDTEFVRQGITYNEDGRPISYAIRDAHEFDTVFSGGHAFQWSHLPREQVMEDGTIRRVVIHGYNARRSEQGRGITRFAPVIKLFKDVVRLAEAEIGASTINSLLALFFTSDFDPERLAESLELTDSQLLGMASDLTQYRNALNAGYEIGGNKAVNLAPGDNVEVPNNSRQTQPFNDFERAFIEKIAAALGTTYFELVGDWGAVNYSSARAGMNQTWDNIMDERGRFGADTLDPIEHAVIQEALWRGYLDIPDGWPPFEGNEAAYLKGYRLGPGKTYVDGLKEAQADEAAIRTLVKSRSQVVAERGRDFEEVCAEHQRDRELMDRYAVTEADMSVILSGQASGNDEVTRRSAR